MTKWLDTYALIEISIGNPKFLKYINSNFVVSEITLAEFYAVLLREQNRDLAEYWYEKLDIFTIPIDTKLLIKAIEFRHKHKKTGMSFFDAVGYIHSLRNNYQFVTGD